MVSGDSHPESPAFSIFSLVERGRGEAEQFIRVFQVHPVCLPHLHHRSIGICVVTEAFTPISKVEVRTDNYFPAHGIQEFVHAYLVLKSGRADKVRPADKAFTAEPKHSYFGTIPAKPAVFHVNIVAVQRFERGRQLPGYPGLGNRVVGQEQFDTRSLKSINSPQVSMDSSRMTGTEKVFQPDLR